MKKLLLIAVAGLLCWSAHGQGRYRQMELSAGAAYGIGLQDFSRLHDVYTAALWYSYWINDNSTIDVGVSYLQSKYSVNILNYGQPAATDHPSWDMFSGTVGARYQPQWDFFLNVGVGAGLGYETWNITAKKFPNRTGQGMIYYLLADVEYPIRPWISVGAYCQPYFLPLGERLEKTVTINPDSTIYYDYDRLANSFMLDAGVWLKLRIY
jgi:hypothetical protein